MQSDSVTINDSDGEKRGLFVTNELGPLLTCPSMRRTDTDTAVYAFQLNLAPAPASNGIARDPALPSRMLRLSRLACKTSRISSLLTDRRSVDNL